ncbi:MAG: hydroxymethylbilane synthase [Verrucomicrobiota bacterium]|nr:hydroxymethylbilane synthase [Verrucomicrobiota bacterium]
MNQIVLGTRGSALALAQAELARVALQRAFPALEVKQQVFLTRGDQKLDLSLIRASEAGGKGLFTRELEEALLTGAIDVAVHSLKDLPGHNPDGLEVTAVLERAPSADLLLSKEAPGLDALPPESRVGTSSVRRSRQLQWHRPDLVIEEWRGNVPTRLRKLGERDDVAVIVLAQAGLERLSYRAQDGILELAPWRFHVASLEELLLPAIGQGAIALQSRADRPEVTAVLRAIDHAPTHLAIRAERELQKLLAGDCSLPVGVRTVLLGPSLKMAAILFAPEGGAPHYAEAEGSADAPEEVAARVFSMLQGQ